MNLIPYVLTYNKPELNWLDGEILKNKYDIDHDTMLDIDFAIHLNQLLVSSFKGREATSFKYIFDKQIESFSSQLSERLSRIKEFENEHRVHG